MELSAVKVNRRCLKLSEETLKMLKNYSWKGNIRELKNVIERAVILSDGDTIEVSSLPADIRIASGNSPDTSPWSLEEMEKQHIRKVLLYARGNKTEAARLLNIGLTTLYRKIEEYRIIG
jgi:DNA-binding NtrC family response regulator